MERHARLRCWRLIAHDETVAGTILKVAFEPSAADQAVSIWLAAKSICSGWLR